jgi:hypothetical protein
MGTAWWNAAWGDQVHLDDRFPLPVPKPVIVRAAYIAVIFLGCGLVYLGGPVLAGFGAFVWQGWGWRFSLAWSAVGVVSGFGLLKVEELLSWDFHSEPGLPRVLICNAALILTVVGSVMLPYPLCGALSLQTLHDRGVIELAVVTTEHVYVPGNGDPDRYSYGLRALDGPPIRRDTGWSSGRLAIGKHITVLSDPAGEVTTSLQLHVSPREQWTETAWIGGIAMLCLWLAAWTWPRPARYRPLRLARPSPPFTSAEGGSWRRTLPGPVVEKHLELEARGQGIRDE